MCEGEVWDLEDDQDNRIYHRFTNGSRYELNILDINLCHQCYDELMDKILPLFKKNPLKEYETFNHFDDNKIEEGLFPELIEEHDNDPY